MKSKAKTGASTPRLILGELPEVEELGHMGVPSFRVGGKIFAQFNSDESVILVKLTIVDQEVLISADPSRFSVPKHWSTFGWTYVRVAGTPEDQLQMLIERSWKLVAPRKLARAYASRESKKGD